MRLVNENEGLPLELSLNSDSWVTRKEPPLMYKPYGIVDIAPASGPYSGFTDVMITGKGFVDEYKDQARCRFGIDSNYVIVEAEVLDYGKMVCRSPQNFPMPLSSDMPILSVPFGIAFGEEKFSPWTIGLHRYRFYSAPRIELAIPDETRIGKFAEVYLKAYDEAQFFERKFLLNYFINLIFSFTNTKRNRCYCYVMPVGIVRNKHGNVCKRDFRYVCDPAH